MARLSTLSGRPRVRGAAVIRGVILAGAIGLAGCVAAPRYETPPAPADKGYTSKPVPEATAAADGPGGTAQRFSTAWTVPRDWWRVFECEPLNRLIEHALATSPTLGQARARLIQAREVLAAQTGAYDYPQVDTNASVRRQRISTEALGLTAIPSPPPFTLYGASLSVSYTLDLFGARRQELEGLRAEVDYQAYEMEAARLSLSGNITTAAVREAALRGRLEATLALIADDERQTTVVEHRLRIGAATPLDLAARRAELAQSRASAALLQKQIEQAHHQLALYAGFSPAEEIPEFRLDGIKLPEQLPVSVPAALARQRPDIRAATSLLQRASADVGVATANLYPQITLSGGAGSQTVHAGNLFSGGTQVWNFGAGVVYPLFHGGELNARRRAALAAYDQAMEAYRDVVLHGLQEVADALTALEGDAQTLRARADAAAQTRFAYEVAAERHRIGSLSTYDLLESERRMLQALLDRIQSQSDRLSDTAALIQALGGGWWLDTSEAPGAATP